MVCKLRRGDELTAEGRTGEEIAVELGVAPATLNNCRPACDGLDTDAAKGAQRVARAKRKLLAETELINDAVREVAK